MIPLAAVLALSATPPPGSGEEEPEKPLIFGTEVMLVSVPVFVTDREGQAMRGLQPEDFELRYDGKRVQPVSFQYVDTTSPEDQEAIRESPAARRRFLFFFDMSFTDPAGLQRAQAAARRFLRGGLAPSDLAAVATFDVNRGVRIVANFSEDRVLAAHAVDTLGVPSLARIEDPLGLQFGIAGADVLTGGQRTDETNPLIADAVAAVVARQMRRVDETRYRDQVSVLLQNLEGLARALRGIEGRKQVLYFSAGFDARSLVGASGAEMRDAGEAVVSGRIYDVDGEARYGDSLLRSTFRDLARALSNADSVVHSIDVTGLGREDSVTRTSVRRDSLRATQGRESLHYLSAETGGRFFKDTNDVGTILGEVVDMTSRFYVLGFQPEKLKGPGEFHKIKVKVRRRGSRVSHRAGFFEREPLTVATPLQRKFEVAQLVMTGVGASDLDFDALCLPFPKPGERQTLGLVLQVPKDALPWQPGRSLGLEFYGYVVDENGSAVDHLAQLARIDPARADPQQSAAGVSLYATLDVPPGRYTIRLLLVERERGAAGVRFIEVNVPPYDPQIGFLLPPLVADDPTRWVTVAAARTDKEHWPFRVGDEIFFPRANAEIRSESPEKLVLLAYEPERRGSPAAGIEIRSSMTSASGGPVPSGLLSIERVHRGDEGRRAYVLGYTPESMAPGDYTLRIGIGEAGTQLESYARLRVRGAEVAAP